MRKGFSLDVCLSDHREVYHTDYYGNDLTYTTAGERDYSFVWLAILLHV